MGVFSLNVVYNHVRRHKLKYITGGFCIMFTSMLGVVFTLSRKVDGVYGNLDVLRRVRPKLPEISDIDVVKTGSDILKASADIVSSIGRNGHPGNVIYCNETKQIFRSHREATRELGIDSRDLWAYLKGIKPNARGYTFTRVGEAQGK